MLALAWFSLETFWLKQSENDLSLMYKYVWHLIVITKVEKL